MCLVEMEMERNGASLLEPYLFKLCIGVALILKQKITHNEATSHPLGKPKSKADNNKCYIRFGEVLFI